MKEPNKTWDQKRRRFIKWHKSICEYCNIKKKADESDLHHKNPVGDRDVWVIQKLRKEVGLPPASFPHLVTDEDITNVQQQEEFRI